MIVEQLKIIDYSEPSRFIKEVRDYFSSNSFSNAILKINSSSGASVSYSVEFRGEDRKFFSIGTLRFDENYRPIFVQARHIVENQETAIESLEQLSELIGIELNWHFCRQDDKKYEAWYLSF